ncbi:MULTISPECIES: FecR family protein [Sphingomonas]|nr:MULTISPECIES: FecR domain-containing protein [Sphingomonas]AGH48881.1 anti-FecI sigma factor FecR [Sphingomonas sp. MM-1]
MAESGNRNGQSLTAARAARWVARMGSDQRTPGDQAALDAWLAQDETHRRAYAEQQQLWDAVGTLAGDPAARAALQEGALPEGSHEDEARLPQRRRFIGYGLAAAAAACLAVVIGAPMLGERTESYATAPGEQRSVTLADGSVVTLDTDSAIEARLTDGERRLTLISGQAFFEVAKDAARPFRVFAGPNEVRALGTAFSVRQEGTETRIFLAQGKVTVRKPGLPVVQMEPGEQARLTPAAAAVAVGKVDPERAQAWRFGRLMFDATPLATAVAEINRYGARKVVLADPALGRMKISGVFHTRQPEAFAETVAAIFPVRLSHSGADTIILSPAS